MKYNAREMMITTRSIKTLKKKTGIVIRVGIAARLLISDIAIAPIAKAIKIILVPFRKIMNSVKGASTHPCIVSIAASHPNRCSSCCRHQVINLVNNAGFRVTGV